ncbi:MAG: alpha/beta fold hydrolase, partial [Chloroflexi bacterium]|nr:alpha/beta fold hydrolase [Chloroflexota bacterium]
MREEAVLFGKGGSLVGVVTDQETSKGPGDGVAVILLNSGVLHHVGPGAIYVKIARLMAKLGFTSLRFDYSGIGDSGVRMDDVPFETSSILEAQEAMDYLEATRGVRRFILMGICSGAVASFEAAEADERVVGAVLMNPRSFGEMSGSAYGNRARMRYY